MARAAGFAVTAWTCVTTSLCVTQANPLGVLTSRTLERAIPSMFVNADVSLHGVVYRLCVQLLDRLHHDPRKFTPLEILTAREQVPIHVDAIFKFEAREAILEPRLQRVRLPDEPAPSAWEPLRKVFEVDFVFVLRHAVTLPFPSRL